MGDVLEALAAGRPAPCGSPLSRLLQDSPK